MPKPGVNRKVQAMVSFIIGILGIIFSIMALTASNDARSLGGGILYSGEVIIPSFIINCIALVFSLLGLSSSVGAGVNAYALPFYLPQPSVT